jgi:molybdopterin converting factor subunit 1
MIYHVLLFARARDLAGAGSTDIELPEGSRVRDLKEQLAGKFPQLRPLLERSALAVNDVYAGEEDILPPAAEIALIPPVSGG